MKKKNQIDIDQARTILRATALAYPTGGSEHEARQHVVLIMKQLRSEGYSFGQLATAFGLGGLNVQPGKIRTMMRDLIEETLFDLIRASDERDKDCLTCPLRGSIAATQASDEQLSGTAQNIQRPDVEEESQNSSVRVGEQTQPATSTSTPTTNPILRCLPLQPNVTALEPRPGVPDFVYAEGTLEHPAIPGLLLTLEERVYGGYLELIDSNGVTRVEGFKERPFRIKWKKPIPMTRGSTDKDFIDINPALFKKRP